MDVSLVSAGTVKTFLSAEKEVGAGEFMVFWKSLTDDEKTRFKEEVASLI